MPRLTWIFAILLTLTAAHAAGSGTANSSPLYVVRHDHWSADDEQGYRQFIQVIGESACDTVNACLHSDANPFRASDPPNHSFAADCADLPYVLRFYYAWKRGLPFSYVGAVVPHGAVGSDGDLRYSRHGNSVASRVDVASGVMSGYEIIDQIRAAVSSATYRIHPDLEKPFEQDFYSPAITPRSVGPGTVIYDPAGHLAMVYKIGADGRVYFFDAHTDNSLTQMTYDLRFMRARPAHGAGFKNWRPIRLVGATRQADGTLAGGHIVVAANKDIADFSDEQYFGNGRRPADEDWAQGTFVLHNERLGYYDYVRAQLAGGRLMFDPVGEVGDMASSICSNLKYRVQAVDRAISAGMARMPEPERLPPNIYGTEGDWETYSTPSRDARLKTAFKALRDEAQRFVQMHHREGAIRHLFYFGDDLVGDMLAAYDRATSQCRIVYTRSDGSKVALSYEQARERLFAMSFDPYQCPERRWGATDQAELSTCPDGPVKQDWYSAEQNLRNQTDRSYDARMDFTRDELKTPGAGKGERLQPDTDVRGYLQSLRGAAIN
ncbi:MAG: hypothetical protein KGI68_09925 [Alphaproteobacteria bacterium]|nr:hypothetical protein [Alphaproteobacteria bacterium]MDE1985250.1 hypothetical protein [Alphaproteobacteria bacterium]MDE2162589.1 hypothetical protein [Alphaproteobacteria bacterium]MDE2266874.1 hypothetical protein [Alphaproteobacteria bacterium]